MERINFRTRRLGFRSCKVVDLEKYCFLEGSNLPKKEREKQILQRIQELLKEITDSNGNLVFVTILDEGQRVIGMIRMRCLDTLESVSLEVSIPNEMQRYSYGAEALHQFIKKMKESYKQIEIDPDDPIVAKYIQERGITPPVVLSQQK